MSGYDERHQRNLGLTAQAKSAGFSDQREEKWVKMPTTADGNPKFSSLADGVESGVVVNGVQAETIKHDI